jgi:hypothetical protein
MDIDRGYAVMATLWTESVVAALVVLMRLYARAQIRKISWDDWLMFITLVHLHVKTHLILFNVFQLRQT